MGIKKIHIPKKKKINWGLWVTLGLVFLMITSTIGFLTGQGGGTRLTYNEYRFVQTPQGYTITIDGQKLVFQYFPETVETINISSSIIDILGSRVLSVTYDPHEEERETLALMQYNLFKILGEVKGIYLVRGLVNSTGYSLPEITCANATVNSPVLYLRSGNTSEVYAENHCIILTGTSSVDLAQIHDRLLYGLLGIIT